MYEDLMIDWGLNIWSSGSGSTNMLKNVLRGGVQKMLV